MSSIAEVLQTNRDAIVERWIRAVREQLADGHEHESELRNHIPFFMDAMIQMLDDSTEGTRKQDVERYDTVGREHGSQRYRLGFDLKTLVKEYGLLRDIILDFTEEARAKVRPQDIRLLTHFTFTAIADAVDEHARQEQKQKHDAQAAEIAALNERHAFEKYLNGIVSHDLRNPLSAIIMTAQSYMRRDSGDKRAAASISRMEQAAQRALRMVENLLDFTQTRLGNALPITRQKVALDAIVQQTTEEIVQAHPDAHFQLHALGDVLGDWDADRLAQVVQNLAGNALAYGAPAAPVCIDMVGDDQAVHLMVRNTGDPISSERLALIFQPMQRATSAVHAKQNLGLGLYIVWHIVAAHGGTTEVKSSREAGTTFTVHLPRHADQVV